MFQKKGRKKLGDSTQDKRKEPSSSITVDDVVSFLENHPDFFSDRQDLLSNMVAPSRWTGDGIVDMQRFLADRRLREIDDLRGCAQEVIETSRNNLFVQKRTHAAVLALLKGKGLDQLLRIISDELPMLLDVDIIVLGFEPPGLDPGVLSRADAEVKNLNAGEVDRILGRNKDIALLQDVEESSEGSTGLFGAASGLVRSAGLARLFPGCKMPLGVMGLGTRTQSFSPGQGTEMIAFFARVIEICLNRAVGNED